MTTDPDRRRVPHRGPVRRGVLLVGGCVVLATGVSMLLAADLGSDGYSTMLNGITLASPLSFLGVSVVVGLAFLVMAGLRGVRPGIGTLTQVVVVGVVVDVLLDVLGTPGPLWGQALLLAGAFPVLAVGIAAYLGSRTGAGPTEAAALAWDPPVPFRWSYSFVQFGGALVGWLLGATIGVGTLAVILLLGPGVDLAARLLRVDVHQEPVPAQSPT